MPSLNKVTLIGHLGKDPELRHIQSGTPVCNFSMATSEKYEDKETTCWHRVVVWGKLAEICDQYLSKGRLVYIEGRLQYREWEDREGNKRTATEIVASHMLMLTRGKDAEEKKGPRPEDAFDNLPF